MSDNGKVKVDIENKKISGKITAIQEAVVNGNSHYYLRIEGYSDVFIAPISLSDQLPLAKVGDIITIEYVEDESSSETISSIVFQ